MHRIVPIALILFLLGAIVAGLSVLCPAWATSLGVDVWVLPELSRQLSATRRESVDLDVKREAVGRRMTARLRIAGALAAKQLTLLEAAALFRQLNAEWPALPDIPNSYFPGDTVEERVCRQTIEWTYHIVLGRSASQAEALRQRLEAELRGHLGRDRPLQLPAPDTFSFPSSDDDTNLRAPSREQ